MTAAATTSGDPKKPGSAAPPAPPADCLTVGQAILAGLVVLGVVGVCVCVCIFKRCLDSGNCGPGAIAISFAAVNAVPTNKPVGQGKDMPAIGTSRLNNSLGRCVVHCVLWSTCLLATSVIAFAVVLAATNLSSGADE